MADLNNVQTKSFRVTSKTSGKFLGFFNVSDNLKTEDFKLVESKFMESWSAGNIIITESTYASTTDPKASIL